MRLLARIGIARDVLDDAEMLLEAVLSSRPITRRRATTMPACCSSGTSMRGAARSSTSCWRSSRRTATTARCTPRLRRPRRPRAGDRALPRAARRRRREPADLHLSIAHALKTLGQRSRRPSRPTARRPRRAAGFRRRLVEPRESQDLPLRRRRDRAHARAEAAPATALVDRYHLCFALGKAWRIAASTRSPGATTSAATRSSRPKAATGREIIETNTRLQIEVCTREFFARARGCGAPAAGSDFHRRSAPRGLHAARADPGLAFAGRGHPGTGRHSSASCWICRAAIRISTIRATRACSRS